MPTTLELATAHHLAQRRLSEQLQAEATRLWRGLDRSSPLRFRQSWTTANAQLVVLLAAAQLAAAGRADTYVDAVLSAQGLDPTAAGALAAASLAGAASDGRPLESLLDSAPVAVFAALGGGATAARAYAAGFTTLAMILATQVADAGRVGTGVAITARKSVTGYVRLLRPPGDCSRCIVLAGRWYRWSAGFQRHPRCNCIHIPAREDRAGDLRTDPDRYFAGLSRDEQDRVFTKADADAIRAGADINRVVNARRGMKTAAGRKVTTALAGRRGIPRTRLMPEQIFRDATSRDDALRLLRLHGYLV